MTITTAVNYGWVCPKCGRVFSPSTVMCPYCRGSQESNTIVSLTAYPAQPANRNNYIEGGTT